MSDVISRRKYFTKDKHVDLTEPIMLAFGPHPNGQSEGILPATAERNAAAAQSPPDAPRHIPRSESPLQLSKFLCYYLLQEVTLEIARTTEEALFGKVHRQTRVKAQLNQDPVPNRNWRGLVRSRIEKCLRTGHATPMSQCNNEQDRRDLRSSPTHPQIHLAISRRVT